MTTCAGQPERRLTTELCQVPDARRIAARQDSRLTDAQTMPLLARERRPRIKRWAVEWAVRAQTASGMETLMMVPAPPAGQSWSLIAWPARLQRIWPGTRVSRGCSPPRTCAVDVAVGVSLRGFGQQQTILVVSRSCDCCSPNYSTNSLAAHSLTSLRLVVDSPRRLGTANRRDAPYARRCCPRR
jgi:hypothetical protein